MILDHLAYIYTESIPSLTPNDGTEKNSGVNRRRLNNVSILYMLCRDKNCAVRASNRLISTQLSDVSETHLNPLKLNNIFSYLSNAPVVLSSVLRVSLHTLLNNYMLPAHGRRHNMYLIL